MAAFWTTIVNAIKSGFGWVFDWLYSWNINGVYIFGIFIIVFVMGSVLRFVIVPLVSGVKGAGSDMVSTVKRGPKSNYNKRSESK